MFLHIIPYWCKSEQLETGQSNGIRNSETEMGMCRSSFVKIIWKPLFLKMCTTLRFGLQAEHPAKIISENWNAEAETNLLR